MIKHVELYLQYIQRQGVGSKDVVASSPKSYRSYLNSVSKETGIDLGPSTLRSESDVESLVSLMEGKRADSTLLKYRSALRRYVEMVNDEGL